MNTYLVIFLILFILTGFSVGGYFIYKKVTDDNEIALKLKIAEQKAADEAAYKAAELAKIGPWMTSYSIVDGKLVPLRVGSNGKLECMSIDTKNCMWGSTSTVSPPNLAPVNCGNNITNWCDPITLGKKRPVRFKNGNGLYLTEYNGEVVQNTLLPKGYTQLWYILEDGTIQSVSSRRYLTTDNKEAANVWLATYPGPTSYWKYNTSRKTIDSVKYPLQMIGLSAGSKEVNKPYVMTWTYMSQPYQIWDMLSY